MAQGKYQPAQSPLDLDREDSFQIDPRKPRSAPNITSTYALKKLSRAINRKARRASITRRPLAIRKSWQRCVVKIRYSRRGSAKGTWARHVGYITMQSRTGMKPDVAGFNQDSDSVNVREEIKQWVDARDPRMFRIIISPEDPKADLQKLTRAMMESTGVQLGRNLEWAAAIHTNTDNPHVHLVLRGRANGSSLVLPPEMVCGGLRHVARDFLTRQLGPAQQLARIPTVREL